MKRMIRIICAVAVTTALASCKGGKTEEGNVVAPQGMTVLDLSKYGKPFAIFVPDTNSARHEIVQQSYGALDIRVGSAFAVSINEQPADIALRKSDVQGDEVNKLKSFVVDEPSAIVWESEITRPEFHFLMNQKIGNSEYSFEDVHNSEANPFTKDQIQKMYDSCKNIQAHKKESAS